MRPEILVVQYIVLNNFCFKPTQNIAGGLWVYLSSKFENFDERCHFFVKNIGFNEQLSLFKETFSMFVLNS